MRFPATVGWGPLLVVVCGPSPVSAEGAGCGCPRLLAGVCRPPRWSLLVSVGLGGGGLSVLCVFVARRVCLLPVLCVFCVFVVSVLVVV